MMALTHKLAQAFITLAAFTLAAAPASGHGADSAPLPAADPSIIRLPRTRQDGPTSVEAALAARRSVRSFANQPVSLQELSQLLWAAQGITHPGGLRTAPSAGALFPLEISIVAGLADGLPAGIYRYQPEGHQLVLAASGDWRDSLAAAALGQDAVRKAPVVLAIAGEYQKTTVKYGERGLRYVHLEAGHAAQNISLQATVLGLNTVMIGAFADQELATILRCNGPHPLYLIPVGRR